MPQPLPKKIKTIRPNAVAEKLFTTLLIDGSNILELSSAKDHTMNCKGVDYGGIFQFLLQMKIMLQKGNFRYVYVMWDGVNSGQLRYEVNSQYKENRDKEFDEQGLSPYMQSVNEKIRSMENYFFRKKDPVRLAEKKRHKELFYWQRDVVIECLEELFIRQCLCDYTEADDFIGYYVSHKKQNEKIVIMSNDRDLAQLIDDDVIVYVQSMKKFINTKNHTDIMGYNYQNVVLKKMICGDPSDNIKGIRGLGTKTLLDNFPELKTRKVELEEVVDRARKINEERAVNKKKPLKWADNIVNRVTDGVQGDMVYEINRKIIDLRTPLMTDEAKELMETIMYTPIDPKGRSLENLYDIMLKYDIDNLKDSDKFANFFNSFIYVMEKEKKNMPI